MTKWNEEHHKAYEDSSEWVNKEFIGEATVSLTLDAKYINFLLTTARTKNKTAVEFLEEILDREMFFYNSLAKLKEAGFKKAHGENEK